jgi:hypothetical protein
VTRFRRLEVKNETDWNTRDLRRIILRACHQKLDGTPWTSLKVFVRYRRGNNFRLGSAYRNGGPVFLNVERDSIDSSELAVTLLHELDHVKGLRHRDIVKPAPHVYAWAKGMTVGKKVIVPKARPTLAERRYARIETAREAVAAWQRKLKLAQTKLRKWNRRLTALGRTERVAAQAKPRTWVIEYADGVRQEADSYTRAGGREQATHGAVIVSVELKGGA